MATTKTRPTPAGAGTEPLDARSIRIPKGCKPSKAASTDRTRPILTHGHLRHHDGAMWLCTTNSYIAAAVKIEAGGDVMEGYIPIGALRLIEAGRTAWQVGPTAWKVVTPDGFLTYDCGDIRGRSPGEYPGFKSLGVWDPPKAADVSEIGMNTTYMHQIGQAIGARNGCRMQFVGPLRPVWVTPLGVTHEAVAIQMPIRMNY